MIVWPVNSSSRITEKSRIVLTIGGQFQTTLSGVRTMKIDEDDDLEPEAAEAGASLRLEVIALVLDRTGRRPRATWRRRVGPRVDRSSAGGSVGWSVTRRNDTGGGPGALASLPA